MAKGLAERDEVMENKIQNPYFKSGLFLIFPFDLFLTEHEQTTMLTMGCF